MTIGSQYVRGRGRVRVSEVGESGLLMYDLQVEVTDPTMETSHEWVTPTTGLATMTTLYEVTVA